MAREETHAKIGRPRVSAPTTPADDAVEIARRHAFGRIVHGGDVAGACAAVDTALALARLAAVATQDFYTLDQLAARWCVSRPTVMSFDLPRHKFGNSVRLSRADVLEFEAENRQIP